ncbi:MAG: DUF2281 domain-containing protein [Gemmataceae bacterium]|nr:DUF2281 domain-containing protein [Gemmataceae bacterium]
MGLTNAILEALRGLPPDKQQEVLDFVQFLKQKSSVKAPLQSVRGMCADLGARITSDDIADARLEMWGNFPREDI